ncbi:unnamed protein product [Lasius platythorax]|uniref:Uncharacterized protein n=1 Tax=Lasius platythorax TaxID=488582 RepID=A0AAV2NP90_9HYME
MMKAGALMQQRMLSDLKKKQTSYIKNWCTYSDEDEILISSEENYKPNKKEETKTFNTNAAQQQQESLIAQY